MNDKRALVAVSFGTTVAAARKSCIESVEQELRQAFPDYDFYRAFTSSFVRRKLATTENIQVHELPQLLDELAAAGYREVLVQSTHVTVGEEFAANVLAVVRRKRALFAQLRLGGPLLSDPSDDGAVVAALRPQWLDVGAESALVLMGHGSPHIANPAYLRLQSAFDAAEAAVVVGALEDNCRPNLADVLERLLQMRVRRVVLLPFLLVCGDHVVHDMIGEQPESWLSRLRTAGLEVTAITRGLGEEAAIRAIYVQHAQAAIDIK